jgi:hypothetical protein
VILDELEQVFEVENDTDKDDCVILNELVKEIVKEGVDENAGDFVCVAED